MKKFILQDHSLVQLWLSCLWLFYGFLMLAFNTPFVHTLYFPDPIGFSTSYIKLEGCILFFIGLLGVHGILFQNIKANFVFAIFNIYKNFFLFASIIQTIGINNSGWVNEFVQFLASLLLLNKAIYNSLNKTS